MCVCVGWLVGRFLHTIYVWDDNNNSSSSCGSIDLMMGTQLNPSPPLSLHFCVSSLCLCVALSPPPSKSFTFVCQKFILNFFNDLKTIFY